jgi:hypothetical protein
MLQSQTREKVEVELHQQQLILDGASLKVLPGHPGPQRASIVIEWAQLRQNSLWQTVTLCL